MIGEAVELIARHHAGDEMTPYERLLGDAVRGDASLFVRYDSVEQAWLFEQVQAENRCLASGGWASENGRRAGIETTCYALMALYDRKSTARDHAMDLLLRTQNPDGSWPAFEGDDPEGCWTTGLVAIALRFTRAPSTPIDKSRRWLLKNQGREGDWFWKWKFRTVDRAVQFNPDKYGWPWFPGTVSWVIPTALFTHRTRTIGSLLSR